MYPIIERVQAHGKKTQQKASKDTEDCPNPSASINSPIYDCFDCSITGIAVGDCRVFRHIRMYRYRNRRIVIFNAKKTHFLSVLH